MQVMQVQMGGGKRRRKNKLTFQCAAPSLNLFSIQSLNLLTALLRPGVELLPQVDDFDAKTLLAVRPLTVKIELSVQRHVLQTEATTVIPFTIITGNQRYVQG